VRHPLGGLHDRTGVRIGHHGGEAVHSHIHVPTLSGTVVPSRG
jgi:hypothetical protein